MKRIFSERLIRRSLLCAFAVLCGGVSVFAEQTLMDGQGVYQKSGEGISATLTVPDSNQPDCAVLEVRQPSDTMTLYLEWQAGSDTLRIAKMQRPVHINGREVMLTGDESGVDCAGVDENEKSELSYTLPMRDLDNDWQRTRRGGVRLGETNLVFISMSGEETLTLNKQEPTGQN